VIERAQVDNKQAVQEVENREALITMRVPSPLFKERRLAENFCDNEAFCLAPGPSGLSGSSKLAWVNGR
jgi:hypothetical protein